MRGLQLTMTSVQQTKIAKFEEFPRNCQDFESRMDSEDVSIPVDEVRINSEM